MAAVALLILSLQSFAAGPAGLKSYNIDAAGVTVSGVSSGAYMAVQMHVAHSKLISGVASVAGGVFWCAKGEAARAQDECMGRPAVTGANEQILKARELASAGTIDPLKFLNGARVYVFASSEDRVIHSANSQRIIEFYGALVNPSAIQHDITFKSAHGFPTLNVGAPCGIGMIPWLLKCGFDLAGEILKVLYGELNERGAAVSDNLLPFSQRDFGAASTPLFESGWIYVPKSCQRGEECRLHIALHGCQMNPEFIQDRFVASAGYNEWAETNGIIVLYPQSAKVDRVNPYACWDWFGFTGENYVTQSAPQVTALKRMIDRVMGK